MNRTTWIVLIAVCILGLGGLVIFTKKDAVDVDNIDTFSIIKPSGESVGDHVYGKADSKVVVYEYADFQCPGCAASDRNLSVIRSIYKDKVAFVFRNYPITSIHPNALAAASAAEATQYQGKYWEMHSLLFERQNEWSSLSISDRRNAFVEYAKQLGIDENQFKTDLARIEIRDKIQIDRALADKAGVNSTPTIFIGSKLLDSDTTNDIIQQSGKKLMDELDKKLKEIGETPPSRN